MFQRLHFHLVRLCAFHGRNVLALQIGIHQQDHRLVVSQIADNGRDRILPGKAACVQAPVSGDHFIAASGIWPDDGGIEHAELHDAVYRLLHEHIVHHLERMILEGVDIRNAYLLHLLRLGALCVLWFCLLWHSVHLRNMRNAAGHTASGV